MKDLKRKLYAIALAGLIMSNANITAHASELDDIDMSPINIDEAITELVPDDSKNEQPENSKPENKEPESTKPVNKEPENTKPVNQEPESNELESNTPANNDSESNKLENNEQENTNEQDNQVNDQLSKTDTICTSHSYNGSADDVTNQVAPSCTSSGSYTEIYYCTNCGQAKNVNVSVPAPGHSWSQGTTTNKTEKGYDVVYRCTNKGCSSIRTEHFDIEVPVETTAPTKPTTPVEPTKPSTPSEPATPTEKPGKPSKPSDGKTPKTGDDSNIEFYTLLLAASGLGLGIIGKLQANSRIIDDSVVYAPKFLEQKKRNQKNKGKYLIRK